jgi:hypothetical protein
LEISETANQERQSHGLPSFFVYIPFGSPDGENIILSFAVSTIVFRIKNHIQTENEPRNSAKGESVFDSPEIYPLTPVQKNNCFPSHFKLGKNRVYSAQKLPLFVKETLFYLY